MKRKEKTKG